MFFKFQKILFLMFRVARVSKKRPGSVRVFKNTGTTGQISGWVWTRPSPTCCTSLHYFSPFLSQCEILSCFIMLGEQFHFGLEL